MLTTELSHGAVEPLNVDFSQFGKPEVPETRLKVQVDVLAVGALGAGPESSLALEPVNDVTSYRVEHAGYGSRVRKATDALQHTRETAFDDAAGGAVSSSSGPGAAAGTTATYTNTWDPQTRMLKDAKIPTGAGISLTYGTGDAAYQPSQSKDAQGQISKYGYDLNGNTTETSNGASEKVSYHYNGDNGVTRCSPTVSGTLPAMENKLLCEVRDPLYVATSPDRHRQRMTYDARGRMLTTD